MFLNAHKKLLNAAAALALTVLPAAAMADMVTQETVFDKAGQVVHDTMGGCVLTKWQGNKSMCKRAAPLRKAVPAPLYPPLNFTKEDLTIYFDFNKSTITKESAGKLDRLAASANSATHVHHLDIAGYADRIGSDSYNMKLSERRIKAVQSYLAKKGFNRTKDAGVRAFGESHPSTQCDKGLKRSALIKCLAPDRKVEIEIQYQY